MIHDLPFLLVKSDDPAPALLVAASESSVSPSVHLEQSYQLPDCKRMSRAARLACLLLSSIFSLTGTFSYHDQGKC